MKQVQMLTLRGDRCAGGFKKDAQVLTAKIDQYGEIQVFILVDHQSNAQFVNRTFVTVHGNMQFNQMIDANKLIHVATLEHAGGWYHVFEECDS